MRKVGIRQELLVSTNRLYEVFRHACDLQRIKIRSNGI